MTMELTKKFERVMPIWAKVIKAIYEDRSKFKGYAASDGGLNGGKITALRLEQAACNHLFDDHFELFNITEDESHMLRAYIESTGYTCGGGGF